MPSSEFNRRRFLGGAAAAGALAMLPTGMAQALTAPRRPASMSDVKHVVVLMQENRSFDHYYGSMSGVRGFADRTAVVQPNGLDVFHQTASGGNLLPYHVDTFRVDGQDDGSLDHGWASQHDAVAGGWNNDWIAAKGSEQTMAYFNQPDIPYHRALANAFTICDHYHCSLQGPTTPNRLFLFSGTIDAAGQYEGPVTGNPADYKAVYSWQSYPEFLEQLGVSWQVYANTEVGDDSGHPFVGDYGDNPLWLFKGIQNDATLKAKASVTPWQSDSGKGKDPAHVLSRFVADCESGSLPSVSWIVAPYGYCEHPAARPLNGQIYTQTVLKALWANPELWSSTALLITYDENDGLFDHVPPPMPPAGTADEFISDGTAVGLGVRVPMTVISPWSAGGWVSSEVFDHTSVIRFTETLFHPGSPFPNISDWRRSVCGDLTSCFDFDAATTTLPSMPSMPTTAIAPGDPNDPEKGLPGSQPPALGSQTAPTQDSGTRPARPLPYQPMASLALSADKQSLVTTFTNAGSAAVTLGAYRADGRTDGPWPYLVPAGGSVSDTWQIHNYGDKYKIAVHGPNRFLWQFEGDATTSSAGVEVVGTYTSDSRLLLTMTNSTGADVPLTITANHYRSDGPWSYTVPANGSITSESWNLLSFDGWYDLSATVDNEASFLRRYTGHFETGQDSVTG
ncbi:MAG TPA: phospholipase C, phosphocholine-specific [Pseudonocardiaceae bacterium]